jgi:hypothetical protein
MKKLSLLVILSLSIFHLRAQTYFGSEATNLVKGAREVHISAVSKIPALVIFEQEQEIGLDGLEQWFEISFNLDPAFGLKLINAENDKIGF